MLEKTANRKLIRRGAYAVVPKTVEGLRTPDRKAAEPDNEDLDPVEVELTPKVKRVKLLDTGRDHDANLDDATAKQVTNMCVIISHVMLLLNETSLFYFDLRVKPANAEPSKRSSLIKTWATAVSKAGPTYPVSSRANDAVTASAKSSKSVVPSAVFSAASIGTSNTTLGNTKCNPKQDFGITDDANPDATILIDDSDDHGDPFENDEETERQAAVSSPHKGFKRLTSQV